MTVERMLRLIAHNAQLGARFQPGVFDGDLLLFVASEDRAEVYSPTAWAPHVSGRITAHEIGCTHLQMTDPGPLARIGGLLDEHLRQLTLGETPLLSALVARASTIRPFRGTEDDPHSTIETAQRPGALEASDPDTHYATGEERHGKPI